MPEELPILFDFPSHDSLPKDASPTGERDLPVIPLLNTVLFPHMLAPLFVRDSGAIAAVERALAADRLVLAVAQRDLDQHPPGFNDLYPIGVESQVQPRL